MEFACSLCACVGSLTYMSKDIYIRLIGDSKLPIVVHCLIHWQHFQGIPCPSPCHLGQAPVDYWAVVWIRSWHLGGND